MEVFVQHIDAFSSVPNKGNPAGVVLDGDNYTELQMLEIAKKVGFNETVFVVASEIADFRFRYFTPGHENNLCGHATMGAIYALKMNGDLKSDEIAIETNVGVLPLVIECSSIKMKQAKPTFKEFRGSRLELAKSIGLSEKELHPDYPIMYGSTGIWTLIIPIKKLSSFVKMNPQTDTFPEVLNEMPRASLHPFCFEVRDKESFMHGRHFSSPYSGTIEDAVTGTASGVMGAYYQKFVHREIQLPSTLIVEQGHEMNKDGKVYVHLEGQRDELDVYISGNAVHVKEFMVELNEM
ncbi:PhzF family phenazine biosynthesis protein [Shouchella patagoniensis]|uniref:PhzF family phenazine biosynthesis protein n=1 Tax=Shouchella patagoniensis TaxID=228576 RepID=UPI00099514B6|nr:PhzF family phenazine biosynthesis isomerase [Shouchella patagoniensis]